MTQQEKLLVIATFAHPGGAEFTMGRVQTSQVPFHTHAILVRDEDDKVRVWDAGEIGLGRGAIIGAIASVLIPGFGLVSGAIIGGIAAKLRDAGSTDQQLRRLAESLPTASSALVLVIDPAMLDAVQPILERAHGTVTTRNLDDTAALPTTPES